MTTNTDISPQERTTRAVISFSPPEDCPLRSVDGDVVDAQTLIAQNACHCEYRVEATITHSSRHHEKPCLCHVFAKYDCIPDVLAVADDRVDVSVFLSGHEIVCDLIDDLESIGDHISLRRIRNDADDDGSDMREVNFTELTEKQQRALEMAVDRGYYETPSTVSLSEIAASLDVTKQAVSQRLSAAERKVLSQVVDS